MLALIDIPDVEVREKEVDADIASFDVAFQALGNDPLVRAEKAILKTYLAWKLGLMKKKES